MSPELAKRLALVFPGAVTSKVGVTGVTGVADADRDAMKPQEIRRLRPLRHENGNAETKANQGVAAGVASPADLHAIEERAALAADSVPAIYLDAWARLQCQRPLLATGDDWRRAIDDAGLFLDAWGADAEEMQWGAGVLFDVPREGRPGGLVWQLKGERVEVMAAGHVRLNDGRVIENQQFRLAPK
jgi:hypothetical protein